MNNYAKYQHPKQKFITFLKKNGPVKEKKILNFFSILSNLDEQLYQICSTWDEILQQKPTHWIQGHRSPPPFEFFSQNINGFIQLILSRDPNEPKCEI